MCISLEVHRMFPEYLMDRGREWGRGWNGAGQGAGQGTGAGTGTGTGGTGQEQDREREREVQGMGRKGDGDGDGHGHGHGPEQGMGPASDMDWSREWTRDRPGNGKIQGKGGNMEYINPDGEGDGG